jgi:VWFA-related protein
MSLPAACVRGTSCGASSRAAELRASPFRLGFVLTLFAVLSPQLLIGRTSAESDSLTVRANIAVVSVPVVVKDQHGKVVYGLTKDDFHIFENGREVKIRSFDTFGSAHQFTQSASTEKHDNLVRQFIEPVPIILFFDQLNTPANEQSEVRRRLVLWYKSQQTLPAPTCVILYTGGSKVRILQQPTTDAANVRAAIESIPATINSQGAGASGELPLPDSARENQVPLDGQFVELRQLARRAYFWSRGVSAGDTSSALAYAAQLFAGWTGEKALIWISAGTTSPVWTAPLQAAQVRLYSLNVHANIPYEFTASFTRPDSTSEYESDVNHQLLENLREAAKETGGDLCLNSLLPQTCVQQIEDDATSYYLLSYEAHSQSTRPEWRSIRVKLDRGGLVVSARTGVLIDPALTTSEKKREQIASALFSPVDLPGLLFEVQVSPAVDARQLRSLSVVVRADATHPGVWNANGVDFTVASLVFGRSNKEQYFGEDIHGPLSQKTISNLDASTLRWTRTSAIPKDATAVRVVVRDNATGRIGSITKLLSESGTN